MPDTKAKRERLLEVYRGEAAGYTIYRDAGGKEKVELRNDPVYVWTNPVRFGQDGEVFVWTCRGRAEVIGTIFSSPAIGPKVITHEFHSLATTVLDVTHGEEPEDASGSRLHRGSRCCRSPTPRLRLPPPRGGSRRCAP